MMTCVLFGRLPCGYATHVMNGHATTEATRYDFSCEDLHMRARKRMWQTDESEQHKPLIEEPHPGILKFSTSPLHSETKSQKKKGCEQAESVYM